MRLRFSAELFDYDGQGSWHFVSLPAEASDELRARTGVRRGFGAVRVRVRVGGTTWSTSVFPSKSGPYVLPVKRAVRDAEAIEVGESVQVSLEVIS